MSPWPQWPLPLMDDPLPHAAKIKNATMIAICSKSANLLASRTSIFHKSFNAIKWNSLNILMKGIPEEISAQTWESLWAGEIIFPWQGLYFCWQKELHETDQHIMEQVVDHLFQGTLWRAGAGTWISWLLYTPGGDYQQQNFINWGWSLLLQKCWKISRSVGIDHLEWLVYAVFSLKKQLNKHRGAQHFSSQHLSTIPLNKSKFVNQIQPRQYSSSSDIFTAGQLINAILYMLISLMFP